jgi:hypothetical protein
MIYRSRGTINVDEFNLLNQNFETVIAAKAISGVFKMIYLEL